MNAIELERERKRAARESLELAMLQQLRAAGLMAGLHRQYRFHDQRKWAFDFAFTHHSVALEVDGAVHTGGRHTRGAGFTADCEKLNEAALMGWTVLRVTAEHVRNGMALQWVTKALRGRDWRAD